jgi:hypothetical protein
VDDSWSQTLFIEHYLRKLQIANCHGRDSGMHEQSQCLYLESSVAIAPAKLKRAPIPFSSPPGFKKLNNKFGELQDD